MKKKVGIVCNDYKVENFKKNLAAKGYTEIEVTPHGPGLSFLKIEAEESDVLKLGHTIRIINRQSKRSN